MRTYHTLRAILALTTLLSSSTLVASDDLDQDLPTASKSLTDVMDSAYAAELTALYTFAKEKRYNDALEYYEGSYLLTNRTRLSVHMFVASLYLKQYESTECDDEKENYYLKIKNILGSYLETNSGNLNTQYLAMIIAKEHDDYEDFFTHATEIIRLKNEYGEEPTANDFKHAAFSARFVNKFDVGYTYWAQLMAKQPDNAEMMDMEYTIGMELCYCTGHYADAIESGVNSLKKTTDKEIQRNNVMYIILSGIDGDRPLIAANLLDKFFQQNIKNDPIVCVNVAKLFSRGGKHIKAMEYVNPLLTHKGVPSQAFVDALGIADTAIQNNTGTEKKLLFQSKSRLLECAKASYPKDFKTPQPKQKKSDNTPCKSPAIASFVRTQLLEKYQSDAVGIMQDVSHIKDEAFQETIKELSASFASLMSCGEYKSSPISQGTPSTSSLDAPLDLIHAQKELGTMRSIKRQLMRAYELEKASQRKKMMDAHSQEIISQNTSVSSTNLRSEVLKEHGLPLAMPKQSESPTPESMAAVTDVHTTKPALTFVPRKLSPHGFLKGSTSKTYKAIMSEPHDKVRLCDVETLIMALNDAGHFEKADFDKNAGKGSHSKIKLYRKGTPKDQRPKPVILPMHETLKDYSVQHLKELFESCGLKA